MKSRLYKLLLVVVLVGALLLGWTVYAQERKSSRVLWEYTITTSMDEYQISQKLSELGAQGWELVAVRKEEKMTGNFRQIELIYYLKRPKQ